MSKRLLLSLMVLCASLLVVEADKKKKKEEAPKPPKMSTFYKTARTAIKNGGNQDAAKKGLLGTLTRKDIDNDEKAKIHYYAALLEESLNGTENKKAYLKQAYDTAKFFNHLLLMYEQLHLCDSVDAVPDSNGNVKIKFQKKTKSLRKKYNTNILNGGRFFLKKSNYAAAYNFFDYYYNYSPDRADSTVQSMPYLMSLCGYISKNPQRTLKYIDKAITAADWERRPVLQEYKVRTYALLKNDSVWVKELQNGVKLYPNYDFFFVNLADWYQNNHKIKEGLSLADSLRKVCGNKAIYWYSMSKLMLSDNKYEECIAYSDSTIKMDENFANAYYNKGIAYLNLAVIAQESACTDMSNPKCVQDRRTILGFYQAARPSMEKVRKLEPKNTKRWAPALYRIYMNLNMGKEFEEIDKLLKAEAQQEQKQQQQQQNKK